MYLWAWQFLDGEGHFVSTPPPPHQLRHIKLTRLVTQMYRRPIRLVELVRWWSHKAGVRAWTWAIHLTSGTPPRPDPNWSQVIGHRLVIAWHLQNRLGKHGRGGQWIQSILEASLKPCAYFFYTRPTRTRRGLACSIAKVARDSIEWFPVNIPRRKKEEKKKKQHSYGKS